MGLPNAKLVKLRILAFSTRARRGVPTGQQVFEAMFNPASFEQTFAIRYDVSSRRAHYVREAPSSLSLTLVLDGSDVDEIGILSFHRKSVRERVEDFKRVAYDFKGAIHEANYLQVEWGGGLSMACRLQQFTVKYTAFDRGGNPLRAELAIQLVTDESARQAAMRGKPSSPDLTHARVVKHGDTLPLLTREIYGSPERYLDVARFNGLDDFRRLTPGRQIFFPPLAALADGEPEPR